MSEKGSRALVAAGIEDMNLDLEKQKEEIAGILKRHGVCRAAFFGSFATGEAKKDSDIDILIEFRGGKSLLDLVALKIELEEVLGRKVDVLTYSSLSPLIKDEVLKTQVKII
jgi:predicted nucleotidyltransferase